MDIDKLFFAAKCLLVNEEGKFIILKRTNYKNDGTEGEWDIPGGSIDEGEDVKEGLIRELKEEMSLDIEDPKVIEIYSNKGEPTGYFIFVLFAVSVEKAQTEKDLALSHEHSEFKWVDTHEIEELTFFKGEQRIRTIQSGYKRLT